MREMRRGRRDMLRGLKRKRRMSSLTMYHLTRLDQLEDGLSGNGDERGMCS